MTAAEFNSKYKSSDLFYINLNGKQKIVRIIGKACQVRSEAFIEINLRPHFININELIKAI